MPKPIKTVAAATDEELLNELRCRGYVLVAFGPNDEDGLSHRDFSGWDGGFGEWLSMNEKHIDDAMTRAGWEALETCADMDGVPLAEPEETD